MNEEIEAVRLAVAVFFATFGVGGFFFEYHASGDLQMRIAIEPTVKWRYLIQAAGITWAAFEIFRVLLK